MSDPFFIRSSGRGQGGPRGGGGSALRTKRGKPSDDAGKKRRREADNEDDQGGFDDLDVQVPSHEDVAEDDEAAEREREEAKETPAEKRMRLARMYLQTLEEQAVSDVGGTDAAQADRDIIASRLRQEALSLTGRSFSHVADKVLANLDASRVTMLRGPRLPVTAASLGADGKIIYAASKDGSIYQWALDTSKRSVFSTGGGSTKVAPLALRKSDKAQAGHTGAILSLCVSGDGALVATGGRDGTLILWNADGRQRGVFRQHKGPVTGVCFRRGSHQLFSCSNDRTIKVWDGDEAAYVETLFGHQDACTSIDALSRERCLTSGGRDRTLRLWTILEESHLVYRGGLAPIETARFINEDHFVSGADDGSISLWHTSKKKALHTVTDAHSKWITSIATCAYTDLVATGSWDGRVRLWRVAESFKALEPLGELPVVGFVNSLEFSSNARQLVVGVGQEHRLGRWERIPEARNSVLVFDLSAEAGSS